MSEAGAPPAGSSELRKRVLSAIVMGVAAIGATIWGGWIFVLLWIGASAAVAHEWQRMAHGERALPIGFLAVAATIVVGLVAWFGGSWTYALPGVALLAMLAVVFSRPELRVATASGILYASALAASVVLCRATGWNGALVVFWLFATVWGTDILAYFTGRALGGPKLWPRVRSQEDLVRRDRRTGGGRLARVPDAGGWGCCPAMAACRAWRHLLGADATRRPL